MPPNAGASSSFLDQPTSSPGFLLKANDLAVGMSSPRSPADMIVANRFATVVEGVIDSGQSQLGLYGGVEDSKDGMMDVYA